jgi:hypothetical protein
MPINALLKKETVFGPEDIAAITAAFEEALRRLNVADSEAAMATLVARRIIEMAKAGDRNPMRLTECVIRQFRIRPIPDVTL